MNKTLFPFSAVVGQEQAKQALIYGAVNPRIGGVLLCGQKGCAKSTLVRGLANLNGVKVVDLPLNITEDMLIGMIDLEDAIRFGRKTFEGGLLHRANGNIVYVDEVNLLSDTIINGLLDVMQSGINRLERDGISYSHPSEFLLVGSMNPEESTLRGHFLDRFGLYVEMRGSQSHKQRKAVIKQRMAFESDPVDFFNQYHPQDQLLAEKIKAARNKLASIQITEPAICLAIELAKTAHSSGHRAEIVMIETALAIAALNGLDTLTEEVVKEAAPFVLPHRIRESQPQTLQPEDQSQHQVEPLEDNQQSAENESSQTIQFEPTPTDSTAFSENKNTPSQESLDDPIVQGQEVYAVHDFTVPPLDQTQRKGSGRRSKTASGTSRGRYIGFEIPKDIKKDIALDATLRVAAIHQHRRQQNGMAVNIHKSDIRTKKRENRIGATIIFAVDASGSMGAKRRMVATKEAILSLLFDAYQKRDQVGMVAFRKDRAEILLPVTRSIDLAQKRLQQLPTGGRTPLSKGLFLSWQMITTRRMKDADMVPLLVLITDGKANNANGDLDPVEDALAVATRIHNHHIPSIVIDTEKGPISLGLAKEIAKVMKAQYYKIDQLRSEEIGELVRNSILTFFR